MGSPDVASLLEWFAQRANDVLPGLRELAVLVRPLFQVLSKSLPGHSEGVAIDEVIFE